MGEIIFATGGYDEKIVFWNPTQEVPIRTISLKDVHVNALAVTYDRLYMSVASFKTLKLFDIAGSSNAAVCTYEGHQGNVTSMGFPKAQSWLFTGSEDGSVKIWSRTAQKAELTLEAKGQINAVALHPNQTDLFVCDESGYVSQFDLEAGNLRWQCRLREEGLRSLQISGDGQFFAVADNTGELSLWALSPGQDPARLVTLQAHNTYITKIVLSVDSKLLATCSADKTVKLWRIDAKARDSVRLDKALIGHKMWVWDAAFTCDGRYIATASTDTTAKLWSCQSGRIERNYSNAHSRGVTAVVLDDRPQVNA